MVALDEQEDVLADGEGATEPTMTLQRWRRFVDTPPASFTLFPEQKWEGLDDDAREAYDDNRISYHSEMVIVATSLLKDVARQGRLLTLLNRRETGARRMLILSGLQTTGKTTALKQLGRTHELRLRDRMPGRATDRIPVVYVSTPPKGSPRKLAAEFGRFLGLPPAKRAYNTTDITDAVCEVLIRAKVELVLIDEIHNLNLATAAGEDMSDHLKYFTEHLPATFVYAGIDVPSRLSGIRGAQILGRSVVIGTTPVPLGGEGHPESWFRRQDEQAFAARWGIADPLDGAFDYAGYFRAATAAGSTANGVFAARVMWGTMDEVTNHLTPVSPGHAGSAAGLLSAAFGRTRFVYLRRGDVVAQAVSLLRAEQTGVWSETADERQEPTAQPGFNFGQVRDLVRQIEDDNAAWEAWFAAEGIRPYRVLYEELDADPIGIASGVLSFLGLDLPAGREITVRHKRLADELSAQWIESYRLHEARERPRP